MAGLEELSREELIALAERLLAANAALEERVRRLERQVSRNSSNCRLSESGFGCSTSLVSASIAD